MNRYVRTRYSKLPACLDGDMGWACHPRRGGDNRGDSRSSVIVEDNLLDRILGGKFTTVRIVLALGEDLRV